MRLLNFKYKIKPYVRISWVSLPIMEEWIPRVSQAIEVYDILERETVKHGLRHCTTEHIYPEKMESRMKELAKQGLFYVPIQRVGQYSGFATSHPPVVQGKPWTYYGVVSNDIVKAHEFVEASYAGNHFKMGQLLGYPDCCLESFQQVWLKGITDPVWQQATSSSKEFIKNQWQDDEKGGFIRLRDSIPHACNPIVKYYGIRIVPHVACSFDCKHTQKMANDWIDLGRKLNVPGLEDLINLLSMPMQWSALNGIAYIFTPLFKLETNSVECNPKYVVQKEGTFFPDNVPPSFDFPWSEYMKRVGK